MPHIVKNVSHLIPNIVGNNNNVSSNWFSYVRTVYSRENGGIVLPPTKREFTRQWYDISLFFELECNGETLDQCKRTLRTCSLPSFYITSSLDMSNKIKAVAWTRMIMAFNMYAEVRKALNLPYNTIDFIGSSGHTDLWRRHFNGRCVLFISNNKINSIINLIDNRIYTDFWDYIFDIYDNLDFNISNRSNRRTQRRNRPRRSRSQRINTSYVSRVDNPTHSIAQEYMHREEENDIELDINNEQIANMIVSTSDLLPIELRKTIYETCMALNISHPI